VAGENGELVPADDPAAAAAAMVLLARDEERRRRYGERSRELVGSWGYEASVESFARLVRDVAR
jgi:glycosyltransferase involved in cell wall biosynthesis